MFRLRVSSYPSRYRQMPHAHEELHLSLVLAGGVSECIEGTTQMAGPLSVICRDPGVLHSNEWGQQGAVLAQLSIADQRLTALAEQASVAAPWVRSRSFIVIAPFLRIIARASDPEPTFATDDPDVVELVAGLTPNHERHGTPPDWLRRAVSMIKEDWRPGLTVRDVARVVGVHPVYLARCMRSWYGLSVGEELRRTRLEHAARQLATGQRSVSEVAHATGFADEPHLCRSLRDACTLTPGRLRALVRMALGLVEPVLA